MDKFEIIEKGFQLLREDCSRVLLYGFVDKKEIPECAVIEEIDGSFFDHEYQDTNTDGWDEASFWGEVYLPFVDNMYMKFEVNG